MGPYFNDDELSSIIGMSHQLGRKVTVHARYAETIVAMTRHGIDWVLHASHLRRQDFGYVRNSGVPLCPTVTFAQNIVDYGDECGSEPGHVEFRKREIAGLVETFTRAYQMGIPIMAGSETGFSMSPYGEWHAREIELLVTLFGLTPMDAILAMTRNTPRLSAGTMTLALCSSAVTATSCWSTAIRSTMFVFCKIATRSQQSSKAVKK